METITISEEITITITTITMDKTMEAIKEMVETEGIQMEEIKDKVNGNLLMADLEKDLKINLLFCSISRVGANMYFQLLFFFISIIKLSVCCVYH